MPARAAGLPHGEVMEAPTTLPGYERFLAISLRKRAALLSLPRMDETKPTVRWPLILFLHGRGESGSDLKLLTRYGLPHHVAQTEDFPFITLAPQCPHGTDWSTQHRHLLALLDEVVRHYAVDAGRIYLSGMSMGGRGTWQLAVEHPEHFAALAPICGRAPDMPRFFERLAALRELPIWVFHGAKDPVVPITYSDQIVAALRSLGANVRYTMYPDAEHDSWTITYANPELYTWLLSQHR